MTDTRTPVVTIHKTKDGGPLHSLLLECCPPNDKGVKSIGVLAKYLNMTDPGIRKWIRLGRVPSRKVPVLVELASEHSDQPITMADFSKYIYY